MSRRLGISSSPPAVARIGTALAVLGALLYAGRQESYGTFLVAAAACYAIGGLGVVLLTGWAGQLSLAQATLMGLGAFMMGIYSGTDAVTGAHRLPFGVGLALVALTVIPVAVLVGLPALRVRGLHFTLVTLTAAIAADSALFGNAGYRSSIVNLSVGRPGGSVSFVSDRAYMWLLLAFLGVMVVAMHNIGRSRLGRALNAVRDSEVAASVMGINVAAAKVTAFAVAGAYAALAGALYGGLIGNVTSVFRNFDVSKSFLIMAVVVVAGSRSVAGGVLAGVFYVYLPKILQDFGINPVLSQVVGGIALGGTILLFPEGIVTLGARIREWRGKAPADAVEVALDDEIDLRGSGERTSGRRAPVETA